MQKAGAKASAGTFEEAGKFGEMIFNCTKGDGSISALEQAGASIDNKIVIDISNPLDFSKGFPPSLYPDQSNTHSLAEEIQKTFPKTKVVKTLNTMNCLLMVNPASLGNADHANFICGNDADAKAKVKDLLLSFGWKAENLLDLGDITNARGTEAFLLLWVRIYAATQNGAFNIKIVS